MEHLFESENSKSRDRKYTKSSIILIDRLMVDVFRLKIDRVTDEPLVKYLDYFESQLGKIEMTIRANPRYVWQELQDTFDYKYKNDKTITGASVNFNWNHKLPPRRLDFFVNF
jgi:hypothetical protein